jgi:hypothetical protein
MEHVVCLAHHVPAPICILEKLAKLRVSRHIKLLDQTYFQLISIEEIKDYYDDNLTKDVLNKIYSESSKSCIF